MSGLELFLDDVAVEIEVDGPLGQDIVRVPEPGINRSGLACCVLALEGLRDRNRRRRALVLDASLGFFLGSLAAQAASRTIIPTNTSFFIRLTSLH